MARIFFSGERLRIARNFNGLTAEELASQLDVSKQMISKYENNRLIPTNEKIFKIQSILRFPIDFYYPKQNITYKEETFYRAFKTKSQSDKSISNLSKRFSAAIRYALEQYIDFPTLDKELRGNFTDYREAAKIIREKWELGDKPIENISRLLEKKGFVISKLSEGGGKVDACCGVVEIEKDEYFIIVDSSLNSSYYRQQFSLAHELGHYLFDSGSYDENELDSLEVQIMENRANNFASELLLPEKRIREDFQTINVEKIDSYLQLKQKWNVSIAALVARAYELEVVTSDQYLKLQKQISYRRWRKEEPLDTKKALSPQNLRYGIELLINEGVIFKKDLKNIISKISDIYIPEFIIEDLAGLEKGYLREEAEVSEDNKVVFLKNRLQ